MNKGLDPEEQADASMSISGGPSPWLVIALAALIIPLLLLGDYLDMADTSPRFGPVSSSRPPRLLALGADKCLPCKQMAPDLEELKTEYAGRLKVDIINVWEDSQEAEFYGVHWIPMQIFFDMTGKELFRHQGFYSKNEILGKWRELGYSFVQKEKLGTAPVRQEWKP